MAVACRPQATCAASPARRAHAERRPEQPRVFLSSPAVCRASHACRHLASRAASSSDASVGGTAAAAAAGSMPPAAGRQQDVQQQPPPPLDFTQLRVQAAFEYEVQGQCLLRVHGPLPAGTSAARGGLLAASLVSLRLRQRALDAAVEAARQQFPGLLQPQEFLDAYDAQRARGDGAALELLGLSQLLALCSKAAPQLAQAVEEEVAAEGARLRASALKPADLASPAYRAGARWQQVPGFDLPTALTRSPKWQGWLARLREAAVQWGRQQQRAGRAQAPPPPAQQQGQPAQQQQAAGAALPADKDGLSAAFELSACTPDELPMRLRLSLQVAAPQGRQLLNQVQAGGARMYASMDNRPGADVLAQALAADERLRQPHLQAAAWRLLRLGGDAAFECQLAAAPGGRPASPGSGGGGGSSGEPFCFSGSLDELRYLAYALHWLEGTELGRDPQSAGAWVPSNGRVRLQRAGGSSRGLGRLLGWRRGPAAGDADAAGAGYRLAVWPSPPPGADPLQPVWGRQGEPASAALGPQQLAALMDCIDAFASQHPGWVRLELPEPLQAPPPGLRQRLAAWLPGGGGDGSSGSSGGGGADRGTAAALPPGTRLGGGTPA